MKQAEEDARVFTVEIDLDEVEHWRNEEQIFAHRRPRLYRALSRRESTQITPATEPWPEIASSLDIEA